ncbi:MAG: hypothetical protein KGZ50_05360 [Peptococcaceae bacterium]|nr:hypothetical protein [Peptococcaceae bacterium]
MAIELLLEKFNACMGEAKGRGDLGSSAVIEAAGADALKVLRAVQTLTDGKTFSETLLLYLDQKGRHPVEFYTAANISAQTWSQMQDRNHHVSKTTVFRAVLTLRLDYLDAAILMEKAGYTFRTNDRMDMVMICLLRVGIYDQKVVDDLLYGSSLPTLFSIR